jgi:acetate---CoA ligase (ADP-forming)
VVFALAPLDRDRALELLDRIRGRGLLQGYRGKAPLKKETMADILVRLGQAGTTYSRIAQIDVNPLVVRDGLPLAVDANVMLKR